jgi:hypothetical protein
LTLGFNVGPYRTAWDATSGGAFNLEGVVFDYEGA